MCHRTDLTGDTLHVLIPLAGAFPGLPKYTPAIVTRSGKSECAAYLDLAAAYAKGAEDVRKAATAHVQAFTDVRAFLLVHLRCFGSSACTGRDPYHIEVQGCSHASVSSCTTLQAHGLVGTHACMTAHACVHRTATWAL